MLNEEKFIENTDNKFVRNHDIVGIQEVIIHIFEKYAIKAPLEITGLIIDLLNEDKIKFDIKKSIVDDLELSS